MPLFYCNYIGLYREWGGGVNGVVWVIVHVCLIFTHPSDKMFSSDI